MLKSSWSAISAFFAAAPLNLLSLVNSFSHLLQWLWNRIYFFKFLIQSLFLLSQQTNKKIKEIQHNFYPWIQTFPHVSPPWQTLWFAYPTAMPTHSFLITQPWFRYLVAIFFREAGLWPSPSEENIISLTQLWLLRFLCQTSCLTFRSFCWMTC